MAANCHCKCNLLNSFEYIYQSVTWCICFRQENVSIGARQSAQSWPVSAVLHRDGRHARGLQTLQVCWRVRDETKTFNLQFTDIRRSPRYVYHSSQWMVAGNTDHSCISPRLYVHPDSPCAGETWMRQVISFDRVKLTNNEMDDKGHVGNRWPVFSVALARWSQAFKTLNIHKGASRARSALLVTILNHRLNISGLFKYRRKWKTPELPVKAQWCTDVADVVIVEAFHLILAFINTP